MKKQWILLLGGFIVVEVVLAIVVVALLLNSSQPLDLPPTLDIATLSLALTPPPQPTEEPSATPPPTEPATFTPIRPSVTPTDATAKTPTIEPSPTITISLSVKCVITATGGLGTEIYNAVQIMPGPGTNGLVLPTDQEMEAWEKLIKAILVEDTRLACGVIQSFGFPYELVHFTDVRYDNEAFWLLREIQPISRGWGTYIFRPGVKVADIIVEVPHPLADWRTDPEGVDLFRQLNARALLVAGTHRCSNSDYSGCTGQTAACGALEPYRESDVAHAVQNMFQVTHRLLSPCGGRAVAIQLHANDLPNCPDLFISNGTLKPNDLAQQLFDNARLACRDLTLDLADAIPLEGTEAECAYTGADTVQGLFANGCETPSFDACTGQVTKPIFPEQFFHLEQSTTLRNDYACLIEALQKTFP